MQLFIQALLVITYVAGTFCQKITFDNTDDITVGRMYIDGTIGGNVTALLRQNWTTVISIEVMRITASIFFPLCQFDVSGAVCDPYPPDICQCNYNIATDNVHFVVNGTASPDLYKAIIRAQWLHRNKTTVYSNKDYTVPGPVGTPSTTVEPTNGSTETAATNETLTTTESYNSSNATGQPKSQPKDIVLIVCLSVIIPLVVIGIVIGVFCYCKAKSKQSKAVSNNGTDRTAKAVESEQPKPDRPYSEYTNQAYEEERKTSPSSVTIDEGKETANNNLQQHNSHQKDVNNSHAKDNTNDGSASQTVPGEPRQLPPLKGTNIHGQLQPTGQPRPPPVETPSQTVKHNN